MARDNDAKQQQQRQQQQPEQPSSTTTNPNKTISISPRTFFSEDCSQTTTTTTTTTNNDNNPYDTASDPYTTGLPPEPFRNNHGASILGPRNRDRERQDPDMIRPPATDAGHIPNMKWSFADSRMRIEVGPSLFSKFSRVEEGKRQVLMFDFAEWAYVLSGTTRITCIDAEGRHFADDVSQGGLWYFPRGVPHSLQGVGKGGTEFLLIFDDGNFSEDETFLLSDWLAHTPQSVIAKNFRLPPALFDNLPPKEKYIFQGSIPSSDPQTEQPSDEIKRSPRRFTHNMLAQKPLSASGGHVRITDSSNFPISSTVAAAHVIIDPGALREMHWHPAADEWAFFIRGRARITIFAASGTSRTFDYVAGDVGVVPKGMAHYVENLSRDEPVEFLEIFRASKFEEFSLEQWLAETPRRLVKEHLFAGDERKGSMFVESLSSVKDPVKAAPRRVKL
ncbi:Oxalate decarboxylase [Rasamsonia emersonii CBS 393.64]|uniref:Oxalate decarboxylase n=1 Tax=Rasamsonia emersonii (strain ATCC 16479 / CBS 393.64 / IMI 116815) TaxID=1408163 RepID=A0A0F4Z0C0_RASE3|nr:Oxalate decarboxylase [Rasamsonia emersonii CBS 393.64]KKA23795.1 Oxalate decarboxylase [Rasamsonia emersonii CBS 393.64]